MTYYERNLPHWHPAGRIIFLTWRLYGSLPASFLRSLGEDKAQPAGKFFRVVDCQLDQARTGPLWLKDPRIAGYVVRALQRGEVELEQYALLSFVVMANHVHVLLEPKIDVARITKGIKGVTAKEGNQILGRTGRRFWQDESYDHWVRSPSECDRIRSYIERNPVVAGLVARPDEWPWSSADAGRVSSTATLGCAWIFDSK